MLPKPPPTITRTQKSPSRPILPRRRHAWRRYVLQQRLTTREWPPDSPSATEFSSPRVAGKSDNAKMATNAANEQAARLQAEIDALKATPTNRGLVLTLGDVLFDTGKAELNSGASRKLDQLAQFLNEHPDRRVQIDGFTDSVGTDSYNEELSRRRADSVKSALLTRGIDSSRIGTQGYGKAFPVANNTDSGGRQLNRRVEVVIGGDNGSAISPRS